MIQQSPASLTCIKTFTCNSSTVCKYIVFCILYLFRCWIGKRKLDIACEQTKDIYNFKLRWKPFQLSPNTPEKGIPFLEYMRNKYGEQSAQDIINNVSPIYKAGKSLVRNVYLCL